MGRKKFRKKDSQAIVDAEQEIDEDLREEIARQMGRRDFLKKAGTLAGVGAVGVGLGSMLGHSLASPGAGAGGTIISDEDIDAKRISGVRIASEFASSGSGTDADPWPGSAVQDALDDLPSEGGRVLCPGVFDLGSVGLTIAVSATRSVELVGVAKHAKLKYSGTGYAVTITGTTSNYQYCLLSGIEVDCGTKTAGRHGIRLNGAGRSAYLDHIFVGDADIAILIENTNTVYLNAIRIRTANTGIQTLGGVDSNPNAIHITDVSIVGATNYGIDIDVGNMLSIDHFTIEECGTGIYLGESSWSISMKDGYMENQTTVDIHLKGYDNIYPARAVKIENVYINSTCDYAIKIEFTRKVILEAIRSRNHAEAVIEIAANNAQEIIIINPDFDETYLLDATTTPTQFISRAAGLVIENRRTGQIVYNDDASAVAEGDILIAIGSGSYQPVASANYDTPATVTHAGKATNLCVIAIKGFARVQADGAVTIRDTLATSATSKQAAVNNAQVNPKKVIGYAAEGIGGAGLVWTRIL